MNLKDILKEKYICILENNTKKGVLNELVDIIGNSSKITDVEKFRDSIFHREEIMSTGLGLGIAVPHAKIKDIKELVIAIGVSKEGISDYESIDALDVKIVVMVGANEDQQREYLTILSQLVKKLKTKNTIEKIINSSDPKEIYNIFME